MNKKFLILILIIIIAAFFRFYNITHLPPGFYPDEAIYANNGAEAWETGDFKVFYPENAGREGLWPNIIGFFVVKFGHEPWVSRSAAAIFGILTVLGVYFLAKELFRNYEFHNSEKVALLATFLMATSFWHILFSRIGFRAIMAPFFLTWGIYFLLKALRNTNQYESTNSYIRKNSYFVNAVLGGIFFGFGFHTYIAYRATPLLILIILLFYWFQNKEWQIRRKILFSIFYFLLSTIIVAAPLGLYFIENPRDFFGRTSQISIFNSSAPIKDLSINVLKTAGMFNFVGDFNWRHNYAGKPLLFWPAGIIFLIGIIFSIRRLFSVKADEFFASLILLFWLIIAAMPVVVSNEGLPHALRAILMAPAVFILAGAGGIHFYNFIKNLAIINDSKIKLKILTVLTTIFLILLIFEVYYSYFIRWGRNPNVQGAFNADYVEIGRQLNALPKELPKYVIVEASGFDVRGIPMPAQTVMFITDTFTPEKQKEKNLYYVLPNDKDEIPENGYVAVLK